MSMTVSLRDQLILRCSSSVYGTIFENITEIIENENIALDEALQEIINSLESCYYNYTMDFEKHIKNKNAMKTFLPILAAAIKKFKKDYPGLVPTAEERLWNFHRNLEKIIDEEYE